jgi:hypothetical protein
VPRAQGLAAADPAGAVDRLVELREDLPRLGAEEAAGLGQAQRPAAALE